MNNGNRPSEHIVVAMAGDGGRPTAMLCGDREEADALAKTGVEETGAEVAVYQYVGTWKPKAMPLEFVPAAREKYEQQEHGGRRTPVPAPAAEI